MPGGPHGRPCQAKLTATRMGTVPILDSLPRKLSEASCRRVVDHLNLGHDRSQTHVARQGDGRRPAGGDDPAATDVALLR